MAVVRACLIAALLFAARSLQESKNPLNDFCRRWGHQTAQVDGKLYIDGGLVAWNPLSSNPNNYTNTWLIYSDLNSTTQDVGMPKQYANLTKTSNVPNVIGGVLWADEVNKCFYLYGGEFQTVAPEFSFWTYDTILNQWNETEYETNDKELQRVSFGAGTQIEELGRGYYLGGYQNNHTSPVWSGDSVATSNLITYDFNDGTLTNNTGPDSIGRAEGQMVYLPASDGGLLVYFGGIEDANKNGTVVAANMSHIHIFDISSSKWYTQNASGAAPLSRRQFCAGVTWADDRSSYNIYIYGGYAIDQWNVSSFDDIYILTLPSFTWIKAWPGDNFAEQKDGHGGCSANVINRDQMIIIGGWFTDSDECDSPPGYGQHNMNLGYNGAEKAIWDHYDPKLSTYFVPTPVISAVGGGPTGGATATKPSAWDHPDLSVYFTRVPSFTARAATRSISTSTPTSTSTPSGGSGLSKKTKIGAIAGGVVGGLAVLIAILLLILFCLHRHKMSKKKDGREKSEPSPPPVELATTSPVHVAPIPDTAKYISLQQPDLGAHPAFSGPNSIHSRSPSETRSLTSPYIAQAFHTPTPTSPAFPTPYGTEFTQHHSTHPSNPYPPYSDNRSLHDSPNVAYDSHGYPQHSPQLQQHHYSYPTSSSSSHPPVMQAQEQVYYPPPSEPSNRSHPSGSDRIAATPEGTQGSARSPVPEPPSTSTTPAHFYAQPVPVRPVLVESGGQGYRVIGDIGGATRLGGDDRSVGSRGSVNSRRRPVRGKFVEVDPM